MAAFDGTSKRTNIRRSEGDMDAPRVWPGHGPQEMTNRERACTVAGQAIALLANAFNHCENPSTPYRYGHDVQERFRAIMLEITFMLDEGEIIAPVEPMKPADAKFQRQLAAIVGK